MNNVFVPMTRRYPNLKKKVLLRDGKIAKKLIEAWDIKNDQSLVLSIFLNECNNLSNERYWELLRTVWILCGSLENIEVFNLLFNSKRPEKHFFSTPEEAKQLREMPEKITVYRACDLEADNGFSWTTSLDYALHYQKTYDKKKVLKMTIHKSKIFAYINRNNEYEVIILNQPTNQ